jgi:molecular chaperone GrpE
MDNKESMEKEEGRQKDKKTKARSAQDPLIVEEDTVSRTDAGDAAEKSDVSGETGTDSFKEEEIEAILAENQELGKKNKELEDRCALLAEYEDLLIRKQAEFENFKKRINREFDENRKYANTGLILDILSNIDNFERAIDSAKSSKDFDALLDGIVIIENQLKSILEKKYGVIAIDDVGTEFDPNVHDAIMMEESDTYEDDTVIECLQKGYCIHGRVIRPAKVKVAKAVSSPDELDEKEDGGSESSAKGV